MIVLFGGSTDYELTEMVSYDPIKDRWANLPALPETVVRASITSDDDDTIFVTGLISRYVLFDVVLFAVRTLLKSEIILMSGCLFINDRQQCVLKSLLGQWIISLLLFMF